MDTERFIRLRSIFDEAVKLPSTQWPEYVRSACGSDNQLADDVRALLVQYHNAPPSMTPADANPGSPALTIGCYRVLRQLGAGGMGVVYLAVRDDGTFRKNVALKLLRSNLASSDLVQRFHQERQVLADLDHPNIARILDGGQTREGLPYYVMDYVDGEPLDRYCDSQTLDLADRIRVFQQVARAVQYLHEHLVVHRDLKHSNIMVTRDGVVKLLDFGIAKVQAHLAQAPDLTSPEFRLLTPNYASPEQVSGGAVTKASDIYSLGVILYQIITGRLPHEDPGDKLLKDPPLPSANIRQDLQRTPETTNQLRRRMVGDLDQIVLLCLRRDPRQRYASAGDLAADLDRYLEGRSVIARKEPAMERAMRYLKRNRVAVGVGLLIVLACGTGAWQAVLADSQTKLARSREAEVRRLLDVLDQRDKAGAAHSSKASRGSATPESSIENLRRLRRAIQQDLSNAGARPFTLSPERRDLLDRSTRYLDRLSAAGTGDAALASELAGAYQDIGVLYQFGYREKALQAFTNAAVLLAGIAPGDPAEGPYRAQWLAAADRIRALGGDVPAWISQPPQASRVANASPPPARRFETSPPPQQNEQAPPQAAPPPPAEPVNRAEAEELRRLFNHAAASVATAEDSMRQMQADAASQGRVPHSDVTQTYNLMRNALEAARQDLDAGSLASARENIASAETFATRVRRYGGAR